MSDQSKITEYRDDKYKEIKLGPIQLYIPHKWSLNKFDEFTYAVQDGPHITPEYVKNGIPFVSSQNVNPYRKNFDYSGYEKYISEDTYDQINQNCRPEKGDLIISRRATIGPTQLIRHNERFGYFVGTAIIKTNESVNNTFMEQLLNWTIIQKVWDIKSPGSTMQTLNLGTIKEQQLPIPPLDEQQRIATVLYTVDQAIEKTKTIIQQTKRLQKGIRQDVFSLGIMESGNLRPADDEFRETYLGRIPTDWDLLQVGNVCSEVIDCPHSTPKYADDGIPVVRTSEIDDGRFDVAEAPRVTEEGYQERISRLEPEPGDVIFTREAPIGEAFKIPDGMKLCLGQRIMQLRPKNDILDSDFLVELLYSDIMQNWFERSARGSTSKHINVGDMKKLKIAVPSIEEQRRIDSVLGTYRKKLRSEQAYLNRLQRLKQGLMQVLLSGTVRTTDTNITVPNEVAQHG